MKHVTEQKVEPLAWPIPEAAKRAGYGETKFRDLIKAGKIGYVENGDRRLIPDEEIRRLLRDELQFEGGEPA
jgi:excisionase family DNA binding protein